MLVVCVGQRLVSGMQVDVVVMGQGQPRGQIVGLLVVEVVVLVSSSVVVVLRVAVGVLVVVFVVVVVGVLRALGQAVVGFVIVGLSEVFVVVRRRGCSWVG